MSALPAKELTTKQVQGVRFGFYTDDEVCLAAQRWRGCQHTHAPHIMGWSQSHAPGWPADEPMLACTLRCHGQVKRLSVKRIVSPLIFDNLKNPVVDGLYDPALGPIDLRGWYGAPTAWGTALDAALCACLKS